jgi:poly(hydroxyalkanoate) granule-associated protein
MVKKLKALAGDDAQDAKSNLADSVRDSASSIWLAGMGAFSKAQAEGGKVFESLVKEGKVLESQTRRFAEQKFQDVTAQFGRKAEAATAKATAGWDSLEKIFEDRVARALTRLGVPTSKEIQDLAQRVEALNAGVQALASRGAKSAKVAAKSTGTARRAVKRASPRKGK